jgi:hypothetical protein
MLAELFRYQGPAKDGGTLEYVFEAGEQNSPDAVTKEKASEIAADFNDDLLSRPDRRSGNAGISDKSGSILTFALSSRIKILIVIDKVLLVH